MQNNNHPTSAKQTADHGVIQNWVEHRGGRPAVVRDTWDGESGLLRIDFGEEDPTLEEISWSDFFRIFDKNNLSFLYEDKEDSRFSKFIERE